MCIDYELYNIMYTLNNQHLLPIMSKYTNTDTIYFYNMATATFSSCVLLRFLSLVCIWDQDPAHI